MKFKISPKDATIFGIFCVFLLYFCSIAFTNVIYLINEGEFYGFNPIMGLTRYLPGTLIVFMGIVIGIFISVKDTIFENTSGFGLEISDKTSDGYSRWLKEKEMKKAFQVCKVGVSDQDADVAGVVFINNGKEMWVDNGENHTLVIGTTGSGKTTAVVDPLIYSLCKHRESMVCTDPKGEIFKNHAELLKARGYKIVILNFRDPAKGNAWNPLSLPARMYKAGNTDKAIELIDDVASNIVKEKNPQDPFWQNSAADYFAACALGLIEDCEEEQVNINSISYMTTVGEEKFGGNSTYIKEYFTMKGENSSAYVFASNTINSPTETKGGILSTFRQKVRLFASREHLSEMLAYSDFEVGDIGREATAVFIVIHDEKTTYHALATIFIKQAYETLIDVAQNSPGGKLPHRTNFILDEFANMPALKDVTTMVTAARSRAMRFVFIIQNFAQLNDVYGKEDAETIRSNCGNLIYILTTELSALEEISKLCGDVKNKKDEKTESHPLITVSDLQKLKRNEVIIIRHRSHPFRTVLKQGFDIDWGDKEFGKAEYPERETREIKLFDVKEFVKVRKRSKLEGNAPDNGNPMLGGGLGGFGGGMMDSPFGGGLPFGDSMDLPGSSPFVSKPKPTMPNFDVDDLVKRIDAKIAELEAQEKAEEEAKKNGTSKPDVGIDNILNKTNEPPETPDLSFIEKTEEPKELPKIDDNDEELKGLGDIEDDVVFGSPVSMVYNKKEQQEKREREEFEKDLKQLDEIIGLNNEYVRPEINNFSDIISRPEKQEDIASGLGGIVDPTKSQTIDTYNKTAPVDTESQIINTNNSSDIDYSEFFEEEE